VTLEIVGHAIVSADGRIADRNHRMPPELRSDADWTRFQAALDAAALVVLGRLGHEAHPNPGRRRLVVTSRVDRLERIDELVTLWNPAAMDFAEMAGALGVDNGTVAVTGGQQVFDLFLRRFTQFDLVIVDGVLIPDGVPCFSAGWPDDVLAGAGLRITRSEALEPGVRLQVWR
jgi:dihydrofolate reductase